MRLFGIGDPHLSFARPKPMDIFGPEWADHPARLARSWDAQVGAADVVLVAGDVSWGRTLAEAAPDLAFLAARTGRLKALIRGNHDAWWSSASKVRAALPEGLAILQNDALRLPEGVVICGARGWNPPGAPWSDPVRDPPLHARELARLTLSLAAARRLQQPGDALVALLHYPPLGPHETSSAVLTCLSQAGVAIAVYGHLHGADHAWAPQGRRAEVEIRCVAGDYVGFCPQLLLERGPA